MIKAQITYRTITGERKTRTVTYINPESSDVTIKDFVNALYSLTTNTTGDIYKIDTAILLDDDSDDIVTPIVQEYAEECFYNQGHLINVTKSNLEVKVGESDTVVAYTDLKKEDMQYRSAIITLEQAPSWVTMDSEDSFYINNGEEYVARVINIAPPSDTQANFYTVTVKNTLHYKKRNDDGSVSDVSDSYTTQITVQVNRTVAPPND